MGVFNKIHNNTQGMKLNSHLLIKCYNYQYVGIDNESFIFWSALN